MKILLVGNYPADSQPSMLRYGAFLQRELERAGHQVRMVHPRVLCRKLSPRKGRLRKWLGYIDKYILFRIELPLRIGAADIIHLCDHSNSIYLPWVKSVPRIITCHDALAIRSALGHFPANPTGKSGRILQRWIHKSLRHADRIIYVSKKTQSDFEQILDVTIPHDLIYHALNWPYGVATAEEIEAYLRPLGLERGGYLLHVGGNYWYKNRAGVLRMFAELQSADRYRSLRLVMVGDALTEEMREWRRAHEMGNVSELHGVDNEQLRILYSGAFALLFPSLEEGFGWPVLEAQACGCPVITSDRAPLNEIAGDGAKFVDPTRPESILPAVQACDAERKTMVAAGFRNLERFSVERVIRDYEKSYQATLSSFGKTKGRP